MWIGYKTDENWVCGHVYSRGMEKISKFMECEGFIRANIYIVLQYISSV